MRKQVGCRRFLGPLLPRLAVFLFGEAVQQRLKPIGQPLLYAKDRKSTQMPPHRLARKLAA